MICSSILVAQNSCTCSLVLVRVHNILRTCAVSDKRFVQLSLFAITTYTSNHRIHPHTSLCLLFWDERCWCQQVLLTCLVLSRSLVDCVNMFQGEVSTASIERKRLMSSVSRSSFCVSSILERWFSKEISNPFTHIQSHFLKPASFYRPLYCMA